MKPFSLLPALLATTLFCTAQKPEVNLPDFGKIDVNELKMTSCSFEKDANAMYLFNSGESYFDLSGFEETSHHVRIKIFNKKGFDNADIKIRYPSSSSDVAIKHLTAQSYNLDESGNIIVTKVDKNSIFDTRINKRYSEKTFAFPNVKEGTIIEYKYTLSGASQDFWYFQKPIPVQTSRFVLDFPRELIMSLVPYVSLPMNKHGIKASGTNEATEYYMKEVPGLPDEAYMSCREDYLQRMEVRLIAADFPGIPRKDFTYSWPQIIRALLNDEDFGTQMKKNIPRTADLDAMLKAVTDPYQKMSMIHKYVREHMEWNKYDNIWALEGVKSAWKDKKGTSGEINLILINLLKDADLDVHPILVSTRENGAVNTRVTEISQFNKVMAYVNIKDNVYVLDATEKNTPTDLIPFEVMASEGLLIEKPESYAWGWKILWDSEHKFDKDILMNAKIDEKGLMSGNAYVVAKDYAKLNLMPYAKEGNDKLKERLVTQPDITIEKFEVEGNNNTSEPLKQTFGFSIPGANTGDYHYFSVNFFSGLDKNPFVADERQSDIFFGTNQHYSITCFVELPEGYQMDAMPKNLRMIMPDTSISFTRQSSMDKNVLTVNIGLDFKAPVYVADSYPEFNMFYKKLFELLSEKFVYRKK